MTEVMFDKEYSDKIQFRNEIVTAFMFYK